MKRKQASAGRWPALLRCLSLVTGLLCASTVASAAGPSPEWTRTQEPFRIHGNTYYVGTRGLSVVLVTSEFGHTLIDGGMPESAPDIAANIEKLGFKVTDIKAILNTHAHIDHAGGIAELQRRSGAAAYARRPGNDFLRAGQSGREDPQFGLVPRFPPVKTVWVVHDGQTLGVGSNRFQAIGTGGHTPGGASWTWDACEEKADSCLRMVFADSLSAISAKKFRFSDSKDYPDAVADFRKSFELLAGLRCDVLITGHPEASGFFERIAKRVEGNPASLKDPEGCRRYVESARTALDERLKSEGAAAR
jgi:metallo-beta-lactamase class B